MALTPDASLQCLNYHYDSEINAIVVECWDGEDHNVVFATDDPRFLSEWSFLLKAAAKQLEQAQSARDPHICPACDGTGEDPLGPAGEGRCRECHGRGEVTGE